MISLERSALPSWLRRDPTRSQELEPPDWWGPAWSRGARRSLDELVADAVLDADTATRLWSLVARGNSVTIASSASGVGKTTLLTALLDAIPQERPRRFVRGIHDDISRDAPSGVPAALLVNEISPHLPIYCWGASLRSVLTRAAAGDQVLATMHAESATDVLESLTSAPLRLPRELIAAIGWIAVLGNDGRLRALTNLPDVIV